MHPLNQDKIFNHLDSEKIGFKGLSEASTRPPEINPKGAPRESEFYPSPICCLRRNEGQPKLTLSPSSMNKFLRTTN